VTKPIRPDEVGKRKAASIPSEVFEAFNDCIAENWDGREASFTQPDVVARILALMPSLNAGTLFAKRWLDVEDAYRAEGWHVEYDRPGYCENYEATFTFRRKTRSRG
jgi:hypothetical protein